MARRKGLGQPVAVRRLRQGGYPDDNGRLRQGGYPDDNGRVLKDGHGNVVARGFKVNCTKVKPWQPGGWISGERCTYNFKFPDPAGGKWYACRGRGDGVAASCRRMKHKPRGRDL